jgi:hypothetical protein
MTVSAESNSRTIDTSRLRFALNAAMMWNSSGEDIISDSLSIQRFVINSGLFSPDTSKGFAGGNVTYTNLRRASATVIKQATSLRQRWPI